MTGEPTLRHGDHEQDGWVLYLQEQLAFRLNNPNVQANGTFDNDTLHHVKTFQQQHHLLVDGVVGDQTWAALRGDTAHRPGTDGLTPHTHLDHGMHVVWTEQGGHDDGNYVADKDQVNWLATNVGDTPIPNDTYTASVTLLGENNIEFVFLSSFNGQAAKPGEMMLVTLTDVKRSHGSGTHKYEAQLPNEVGGAKRTGEFTVP